MTVVNEPRSPCAAGPAFLLATRRRWAVALLTRAWRTPSPSLPARRGRRRSRVAGQLQRHRIADQQVQAQRQHHHILMQAPSSQQQVGRRSARLRLGHGVGRQADHQTDQRHRYSEQPRCRAQDAGRSRAAPDRRRNITAKNIGDNMAALFDAARSRCPARWTAACPHAGRITPTLATISFAPGVPRISCCASAGSTPTPGFSSG